MEEVSQGSAHSLRIHSFPKGSFAMTTKPFGVHPQTGEALTLTTVTSKPHGLIEVSFTNVGASIVSWKIGRFARKQELVLGFPDGTYYFASDNPFFGMFM